MKKNNGYDLTVRALMERLAHLDQDDIVCTKNYSHASDTVTLNFVGLNDIVTETIFKDGQDIEVVIVG